MSDPRIARKLRDQLDQFELGVAAKRDSVAVRLKENLTRSELQREKLNAKLKRLRVGLGLQSRRS
jgi:hypothetical protein